MAIPTFTQGSMTKQNVVYTWNGILFNLQKGMLIHAIIWMNLDDIMLSEITHSQKDKYCMILVIGDS